MDLNQHCIIFPPNSPNFPSRFFSHHTLFNIFLQGLSFKLSAGCSEREKREKKFFFFCQSFSLPVASYGGKKVCEGTRMPLLLTAAVCELHQSFFVRVDLFQLAFGYFCKVQSISVCQERMVLNLSSFHYFFTPLR